MTARPYGIVLGCTALALAAASAAFGWRDLWANGDQRGRLRFERGEFAAAAASFADPMWRGAALFRAGDFKTAEQVFGSLDSAGSAYDQGNALVMLGQYQAAVARYDRALALRPGWADAEANRALAQLRAERIEAPGGDAGDQREGADKLVYDKDAADRRGEDTAAGAASMSDEAVRALWLKRVQTQPADFLRARFAYQREAAAKPPPGGPP